jgi:hypothetical protein
MNTAGAKANPDKLNGTLLSEICGIFGAEQTQNMPIVYSRHALVKPDDYSQNPQQDIEFLKAQGSFQIPVAPALDEFMRQYFSHVHPHLPLIDESAFWDDFAGKRRCHALDFPISNFTFQAMLFACCSVCGLVSSIFELLTGKSIVCPSKRLARCRIPVHSGSTYDFVSTGKGKTGHMYTCL